MGNPAGRAREVRRIQGIWLSDLRPPLPWVQCSLFSLSGLPPIYASSSFRPRARSNVSSLFDRPKGIGGVGFGGVGFSWFSRMEDDGCEPKRTLSGISLGSGTAGSEVIVSESNCPRAVVVTVATLLVACVGSRATPGSRNRCEASELLDRERTIMGAPCPKDWSITNPATGRGAGDREDEGGGRRVRDSVLVAGRFAGVSRTSRVDLRGGLAGRVGCSVVDAPACLDVCTGAVA